MVPQIKPLSYEYLTIAGIASRPTTVSVAPIIARLSWHATAALPVSRAGAPVRR
jgi:hypothetical protein